ncbi:MAG: hypothetical protein ABEH35_00565 [Haloarculaceae archaeon]
MNALTDRFDDALEPLGVGVGAFLVLVGLVTIVGTPWTTNNLLPALLQVVGALATAAVGAGLAYLSWRQ